MLGSGDMKRFKYLTLAAFVAFAACDEGTETTTEPPITGTISGLVTIEGTGQSGVTVTLSSGQSATTDASGSFSFSGVAAGAYDVTISGFPADASFTATQKSAVIATAGQTVQVNFSGSYVRTSSIVGSVAAGGAGLPNVNVSIGSQSTTTDANGQYAFSGLRAGSYTVSISAFDASMYTFATTSQQVTVAAGESKLVSFSGNLTTTAGIRGSLFIDENVKNDTFDSTEDALAVAGVSITLTTGSESTTVETAADGSFDFPSLAAGTYAVAIAANDPDIPGTVTFGGATNQVIVGVQTGAVATVNWPFDITQQAVSVYAFLGRDGIDPGQAPIEGWDIKMYDTDRNANAGGTVGLLGTVETDAMGEAIFRFARVDDRAPSGGADNIVYAKYTQPLPANHTANGEQIIEIKYDARDSLATAPDTFDAVNQQVVVGVSGMEIDEDELEDWLAILRQNDTTAAVLATNALDKDGVAYFTVTGLTGARPNHLYVRLAGAQPEANGHGFDVTLTGDAAEVAGRYLDFPWSGYVATGDTIMLGSMVVRYTDADINVRLHHEADDSTDVPSYTGGDNFDGAPGFTGELYMADDDGEFVSQGAAVAFPGLAGEGELTFANQPVDSTFQVEAIVTGASRELITDSIFTFVLDGADQSYDFGDLGSTLKGKYGTFAFKFNHGTLRGRVEAEDGTRASGIQVTVAPTSDMIGSAWSGTVKTNSNGIWATPDSLLDGPYMVTVADSVTSSGTVWSFEKTLETDSNPVASGTDDNEDERTAIRDVLGTPALAGDAVARFQAVRMNTRVRGLVVNDRDVDTNTIDPGEGLAGVVVELYKDNSGTITVNADSLVASTTTGSNGAYSFTQLREGQYIVKVNPATPSTQTLVLKSFLANTDTALAKTTASITSIGSSSSVVPLPRFNYQTSGVLNLGPADWTFLYFTGTVQGSVTLGGSSSAANGMNVQLQLCANTTWVPNAIPVLPNTFTCTPSGAVVNGAVSSGSYSFTGLREGVYTVTVIPASVGSGSPTQQGILWILGSSDVQTVNFTVP
jgi:hypothetical protein